MSNNITTILSRYSFSLAIAALPFQAGALDLTPDASRVVSDPSYLPSQGQLYGSTEYSFGKTDSNTNNYLGAQKSSNTNTNNTINQTLEYGLTDDLTLSASESYQWNKANSDSASGIGTDTYSNGFTDPSFGATWRVLDQRTFPVSWDLIGTYAPDAFNAKSASPTEDGTVARGGSTATAGTALSYKTRDFTVYGRGSATYQSSRDLLNQTSGTTTSYDSSWQYQLALNTQTRLTDVWSVNAGVTETFNNNADASYANISGSLINYTSEPGDVTALNVALNYQVIPNRLVSSLIYAHDFYGNSSSNYATLPHSDTTTHDENADVISAELRYVFN